VAKRLADSGLAVVAVTPSDFTKAGTAESAVKEAAQKLNGLDALILNHCYGTYIELGDWP